MTDLAGGMCVYLTYYGTTGTWTDWGPAIQFLGWSSVAATAAITLGLYWWGCRRPAERRTLEP